MAPPVLLQRHTFCSYCVTFLPILLHFLYFSSFFIVSFCLNNAYDFCTLELKLCSFFRFFKSYGWNRFEINWRFFFVDFTMFNKYRWYQFFFYYSYSFREWFRLKTLIRVKIMKSDSIRVSNLVCACVCILSWNVLYLFSRISIHWCRVQFGRIRWIFRTRKTKYHISVFLVPYNLVERYIYIYIYFETSRFIFNVIL